MSGTPSPGLFARLRGSLADRGAPREPPPPKAPPEGLREAAALIAAGGVVLGRGTSEEEQEAAVNSLAEGYFTAGFDALGHELARLPPSLEPAQLEATADQHTSVLEVRMDLGVLYW